MAPACCVGAQTTNRTYLRAIPTTTGGGGGPPRHNLKPKPGQENDGIQLFDRLSSWPKSSTHVASGFVDTSIDPDGNSMPRMMELA
jgi:hypothetical protein